MLWTQTSPGDPQFPRPEEVLCLTTKRPRQQMTDPSPSGSGSLVGEWQGRHVGPGLTSLLHITACVENSIYMTQWDKHSRLLMAESFFGQLMADQKCDPFYKPIYQRT